MSFSTTTSFSFGGPPSGATGENPPAPVKSPEPAAAAPMFGFPPRPESASKKQQSSSSESKSSSGSKKNSIKNPLLGRFGGALTTASPPSPREPLAPLFTANSQSGIRQRKVAFADEPGTDAIKPKAKLTLPGISQQTIGVETSSASIAGRSLVVEPAKGGGLGNTFGEVDDDHTWIMLIGAASDEQRTEALEFCRESIGIVTDQLHPANSNVIAIKFTSAVEAQRAISRQFIALKDGVTFCGVTNLTPSQRRALTMAGATRTARREPASMAPTSSSIFAPLPSPTTLGGTSSVPPRDMGILAGSESRYHLARHSLCERVVAWVFGWTYDAHGNMY